MSGPSHALHLVLKLAAFEAAHAGSALVTKDHVFLGLLKVVDIDLKDYLSELSVTEQLATAGEIDGLRSAFGEQDTTRLRRALRARLTCDERPRQDGKLRPRPSRECEKLLSQVSATPSGWGCIGLLELLMESPGKETALHLKDMGLDPKSMVFPSSLEAREHPGSFARAIARLHHEWRIIGGDNAPQLSDLWRRVAPTAVIEFDGNGGLSLMQGSRCLLRLGAAQSKSREVLLGKSLAQAIAEFEEGVAAPCKAPLAEF